MKLADQYKEGFNEANGELANLLIKLKQQGIDDELVSELYMHNNDQRVYHNKLLIELGENVV